MRRGAKGETDGQGMTAWARSASAAALLAALLSGCMSSPAPGKGSPKSEDMSADQFGQTDFNRTVTLVTSLAGALVFAALHGWIVWKLCTPAVRDQFRSAPR